MATAYYRTKRNIRDLLAADPTLQALGVKAYYGRARISDADAPAVILFSEPVEQQFRSAPASAPGSDQVECFYWIHCLAASAESLEKAEESLDDIVTAVEDLVRNHRKLDGGFWEIVSRIPEEQQGGTRNLAVMMILTRVTKYV